MNQATILVYAIPFAIASYIALWPAGSLASSLGEKLKTKERNARSNLVNGAIRHLKGLRVRLDELFRDYDDGNDLFLVAVEPKEVLEPAREFVRLMVLQTKMARQLRAAQRLARVSFWILVGFAIAITATLLTCATETLIGIDPARWALGISALIFVCGGGVYISLLLVVRRLDFAHVQASELTGADDDTVSLNSLTGVED